MDEYIVDTHALIWYFSDSPRLGDRARSVFTRGDSGETILYIPSIALAELYYANVKNGSPIDFDEMYRTLNESDQFLFVDFVESDVLEFGADSKVTEMHDRMIVGVARRLKAPLITIDKNITQSGLVEIVW